MPEIEVLIHRLKLEPHPNADALEMAAIGGYRAVVKLDEFKNGDLVAYIPEDSIIPPELIEKMDLANYLVGKDHNRVKAIRLRGALSQGLILPMDDVQEGDDVTEMLGITKYVPEVPSSMNGEVWHTGHMTVKFDVHDIKKYPDVIQDGEEVVMTEKLHGTCCQMGFYQDEPIVTQKGIGNKRFAFQVDQVNASCIYVQEFLKRRDLLDEIHQDHPSFYLLGEIYGRGVQDLQYDLKERNFRVFDVYLGEPGAGRFLDYDQMMEFLGSKFDTVPLAYRGPYQESQARDATTGQSIIANHIREGVVIKPVQEREDPKLGRVILKSKSEKYLLRKGNATEFE